MKRFSLGLSLGLLMGLLLAVTTFALASNPIKLIVNGQEVQSDVPPQEINGRVLVPARPLAEALGAAVNWDGVNNAVVVTSAKSEKVESIPQSPSTSGIIKQEPVKEGTNVIETTYNGLKAIEIDGVTYFNGREHNIKFHGILNWDNNKQTAYIKTSKEHIEIENIPENIQQLYGQSYFNIKFYRE